MRWEDERYVRIYTRDTVDWLGLSFLAQGLFCLLLRKVDRAGLLKLGKQGKRAAAIIIGFPGDWARLEPALEELLEDGCVQLRGEYLVIPNFIEAQEAGQSDAQRKRESRARDRDLAAAAAVLNPDKTSESVTECHETGQKVTSGHDASQVVTPNCAVPSRTEITHTPNRPRLVSPFAAGADPYPQTTAVLAALFDRGRDAAPPGAGSAARVEAAIKFATIPVAVDRLAAVYANPDAKKPLTYHVDAIRGDRPKRSTNIGDLGCEVIPWWQRLTDEQARAYVNERTLIDPDLDGAPIGVPGENDQCADLNAKWRAVAEGR
jgi:hypothetical protein